MESLNAVYSEIIDAIAAADSLDVLEAIRIDVLGKKGRISLMMRELGSMDPEDRRAAGQTLNKVKDDIATAIDAKQKILATAVLNERL
jgi:phenylalanyl-tRNA synthetase alpha chain